MKTATIIENGPWALILGISWGGFKAQAHDKMLQYKKGLQVVLVMLINSYSLLKEKTLILLFTLTRHKDH